MAHDDDLLGTVAADDAGAVLLRQLVGGAFDVHIGGLGLAGVDDIQIMVLFDLPCAAPHLVGVEHQNRHAALVACIVAQNVHQAAAGGVQIAVGQPAQVVPGKNHVVAVHQQVIRAGGYWFGGDAGRSGGGVQGGAGCLFGKESVRMMKNAFNRLRSGMETLNLTMLLILNLFFMVFLLLAVCTVLVLAGVDEGFLYHDGQVELGGALAFVYTVCILIAVSMVVMIRMVFIHPLQRNIEAMKKLANGDFAVRVNHAEHGYVPREMVEFEQSFNKAAEELGGTEILRKDFINNFSHEFKTPIVSISGFADLLLEEQLPPEDQKEYLTIIRDESRRLADLATNILTLNRVESQTILTDKACFSLDEQLRQSVLVTQQKWRQKELVLYRDRQNQRKWAPIDRPVRGITGARVLCDPAEVAAEGAGF